MDDVEKLRLQALLKEAQMLFPSESPAEAIGKSWLAVYGLDKFAFVDAATAQAGMGMDPAMAGMDPAAAGGAPPGGDPMAAMDPAAAAAGAPPMDPAAAAAGGLPPPPGQPAIDPTTGQPVPPKIKVDTNAILLQVLRLMALMADHLKIPVPASLMTVMPQELMSLPQQPPSGSGGGGGGAGAGGGAEQKSGIPPIEPIEPIDPAMPKQSGLDELLGKAAAMKLKQGW